MDTLRLILIFLHILGVAGLIGGFLVQVLAKAEAKRAGKAMLHSGLLQLVTGLTLVGLYEGPLNKVVDHAKIGTKLAVAIAVVACVLVAQRRQDGGRGLFKAAAALAVVNVAIAVFWVTP